MKANNLPYIFLFGLLIFSYCNRYTNNENLKTIEISISDQNFKQLQAKRRRALDLGVLLTSKKDYVASGFLLDSQFVSSKIRLKGDWVDHLQDPNKWSFRIKIGKGQTYEGMRKISLQHPSTRNYIYEWVFHKMQKQLGLVALRYNFVNLVLNRENNKKHLGIFALEEAFDKRLIENNMRRSGIILKFDESALWEDRAKENQKETSKEDFEAFYLTAPIVAFNKSKVSKDSTLRKEFIKASSLLEAYRKQEMESTKVFDLDKMGRFMALVNLLGGEHALIWHNLRFYYNPITSLLEPIGFDAIGGNQLDYILKSHIMAADSKLSFYFNKYLQVVQSDSFLNQFLSLHELEMNKNIDALRSEFKDVGFDMNVLKHNQKVIREYLKNNLTPASLLEAKEEDDSLQLLEHKFVELDKKQIVFKQGNWILEKPLKIPSGFEVLAEANFKLDIRDGAEIISESPFIFKASKEKPIVIYSSDDKGDGVLIKNCSQTSVFEHVFFKNLSNPTQENWATTGAVTFYQSPVVLDHVNFSKNRCEDALNIFDTQFSLQHCHFGNTYSDAFDGDFVHGNIENCSFEQIGNDAIDISGSFISLKNIFVNNALDKCISAGEKSSIVGEHLNLINSELAVVSKDLSSIDLNHVEVNNCKIAFSAFQKKSEFDHATIVSKNTHVLNNKILHLVDKKSSIVINGKESPKNTVVKDRLYGKEFGKSSK